MSKKEKKRIILRKRRTFSDESRYYIDKDEYSNELIKYTKTGKATDRLGELFMLHVSRVSSAHNFKDYTYKSDMEGTALLHLLKYSHNYDPTRKTREGKPTDAFSYCTTIIVRAFIQVMYKEKHQSKVKDALIKNQDKVSLQKLSFSIAEDL
jgi:hypothetical protein